MDTQDINKDSTEKEGVGTFARYRCTCRKGFARTMVLEGVRYCSRCGKKGGLTEIRVAHRYTHVDKAAS